MNKPVNRALTVKEAQIQILKALKKFGYPKNYLRTIIDWLKLPLIVSKNQRMSKSASKNFSFALEALSAQRPVEYIVKRAHFFKRVFAVNKHTLIPRPFTEQLVEKVIHYAAESKPTHIIDIGSGSGCIIISLFLELRALGVQSNYTAIEKSASAIKIARKNAVLHNINEINFIHADIAKFDYSTLDIRNSKVVIVTNPPYITASEYIKLSRSVREYEPKMALVESERFLKGLDKLQEYLEENNNLISLFAEYRGKSVSPVIIEEHKLHDLPSEILKNH